MQEEVRIAKQMHAPHGPRGDKADPVIEDRADVYMHAVLTLEPADGPGLHSDQFQLLSIVVSISN